MEKLQIHQILKCNKVLCKILEQKNTFPISVGLKINKIVKEFEEVEDYIFNLMEITFKDFEWSKMTEEQILFYNGLLSQEIELDFKKIPSALFENNNELMISIEDIDDLQIILS
jgi:hypothetical protein